MVTVTIKHDPTNRELCIEAKGHAGYGKRGEDIVCASVSILMYTLEQAVYALHESGGLSGEHEMRSFFDDGIASVACKCSAPEAHAEAKKIYSTIESGFLLLSENYPQYVRLEAYT